MPEPRAGNGLRVFSITLFLCGLLLTIAVLADPPPHLPTLYGFYPQPFGELGNGLRADAIEALGAGVYVFLIGWLVVAVSMIRGSRWFMSIGRASGWLVLTACGSLLADWIGRVPGSITGSGG